MYPDIPFLVVFGERRRAVAKIQAIRWRFRPIPNMRQALLNLRNDMVKITPSIRRSEQPKIRIRPQPRERRVIGVQVMHLPSLHRDAMHPLIHSR